MSDIQLLHGDCLELMAGIPDGSVDAVVTDPPYELGFMGRKWDASGIAYNVDMWRQVLRVLKPGGHVLAFGGTRTYHRMACAMEDAGFEIRDSINWLYGSGFPKSLDVSKALDKAAGVEREVIGKSSRHSGGTSPKYAQDEWTRENAANMGMSLTVPATPEAQQWEGWGTALKPSHEPIVLARKPLIGTVIENVLEYGTGAIHVDATRVQTNDNLNGGAYTLDRSPRAMNPQGLDQRDVKDCGDYKQPTGRWPANLLLTHSADCTPIGTHTTRGKQRAAGSVGFGAAREDNYQAGTGRVYAENEIATVWECAPDCPIVLLDGQSNGIHSAGFSQTGGNSRNAKASIFGIGNTTDAQVRYGDAGGASRFFPTFSWDIEVDVPFLYQAKASKSDRGEGNIHPTVKPVALMEWLIKLITPPNGKVLDPFFGSGSTGVAAVRVGVNVVAIEREAEYLPIAQTRIQEAQNRARQLEMAV